MRSKTRFRSTNGKDKIKEASKRLKCILKTSQKLGLTDNELLRLRSVGSLKTACTETQEPLSWVFLIFLTFGFLISVVLFSVICGGLSDALNCVNSTSTKDIQVHTIRLERLTLEASSEQSQDSSLYNDSEDVEEGSLWSPANLRLHRER